MLQVVHRFEGYSTVWWAQILYTLLLLLSLGLLWVIGVYSVRASLWTLQKCPLSKADYVCVQVGVLEVC